MGGRRVKGACGAMNPVKESTSKTGAALLKSGSVKPVIEGEDVSKVGVGASIVFSDGLKSVFVDEVRVSKEVSQLLGAMVKT